MEPDDLAANMVVWYGRKVTNQVFDEYLKTYIELSKPDYMPMLEKELLEVIRRYVQVDDDAINISLDSEDNCSVLELNVTLPRS